MVWIVPVLIWLVWAPDRPAGGRLWALAGVALSLWAPIWKVPHGSNVELKEHGWQLLEGNSFFLAMVVFMVGVAVLLTMRRPEPGPGVAPQTIATSAPVEGPVPAGPSTGPAAGSVTP